MWNTIFNFEPKPLCKHDCLSSDGKRHFKAAQRGPNLRMGLVNDFKQDELYIVPAALVEDIFEAISFHCNMYVFKLIIYIFNTCS